MNVLHITNGDCAADIIRQTGLPGVVIAWQDVLHEGPVPAGLAPDELREVRARFIAAQGWAPHEAVLAELTRRDEALARFADHEEVVLWFEHDLYDQLQLIQILDRFAQHDLGRTKLSLICIGEFPGVDNFKGLGQLKVTQMASLFAIRHPVSDVELSLGSRAWEAFCSLDPVALERLLDRGTAALPFLGSALVRHLEQYPSVRNGLSRTERQILAILAAEIAGPVDLFLADQAREEHPFMGDASFWSYLHGLSRGPAPLLSRADDRPFALPGDCPTRQEFVEQRLVLTERGWAVLDGRADWIAGNRIDRWLGGAHLHGPDARWRWDERRRRLVRSGGASPETSGD